MSYKEIPRRHDELRTKESLLAVECLIQYRPKTIQQLSGQDWSTVHGELNRSSLSRVVRRHLSPAEDFSGGTLGKWYTTYIDIDIDFGGSSLCDEIIEALQLSRAHYQLYETVRSGGYRIRVRVEQEAETSTLSYVRQKLKFLEDDFGVEVYPQSNRCVRIPFDPKFTPIDRIAGYDVNDQITDFLDLESINLHRLPWPSERPANWISPDESDYIRQGLIALSRGLSTPNSRFTTQWQMLCALHRKGWTADAALDKVLDVLQNGPGIRSKDITLYPAKVVKELQWCVDAIWQSWRPVDYINKDALVKCANFAGTDIKLLRFMLGLFSYLTPRYAAGRSIPVHTRLLRTYAHPRYVTEGLEYLEMKNVIKRSSAFQTGRKSRGITVLRSDFIGSKTPFIDGTTPLGGAVALQRNLELVNKIRGLLSAQQRAEFTKYLSRTPK